MESRHPQRPQWTDRLQVAVLQVALVLALLFAFNGSGRAQGVETGACNETRATMAMPEAHPCLPTHLPAAAGIAATLAVQPAAVHPCNIARRVDVRAWRHEA
ncbi:hypothetical protein E2F46_14865 [Luteimonas aestuarii]|uniref:DUF2946 domain-containing protein n=1 Tax=Luteimonas aestuarii TaxID=453837 RepID=A0A4R5TL27_9GAMM|nr:hypothetical protein [Luteimonas aestuarii]TDK21513.1 hypothetical protein E2F46_14865 [Luteimonas aestuarii]